MFPTRLLAPTFLVALAASAGAQDFNVDFGPPGSAPGPSYGGAAQRSGPWNQLSLPHSGALTAATSAMVDANGTPTNVVVMASAGGGLGYADTGLYGIGGDVGALVEDGIGGESSYLEVRFRVLALLPGWYEVWTYAGPGTTIVVANAVEPGLQATYAQAWAGHPIEGQHYVRHHVLVSHELTIQATWPGWREVLGIQLIRLDDAPLPRATCLGDGTGASCPCGNVGGAGRGCATSFGPGARLSSVGAASVTNDALVMSVEGVSNTTVTFVQGSQAGAAGAGAAFGDGLRCATGTVIRLGQKQAVGQFATYPETGDASISSRGAIPSHGGTRIYQVWFRNAAAFCTPATFNWSNGLAVTWAP